MGGVLHSLRAVKNGTRDSARASLRVDWQLTTQLRVIELTRHSVSGPLLGLSRPSRTEPPLSHLPDPRRLHLKVEEVGRVVALELALDLPPRPEAVGQRPGAALDGQCVGLLRDRVRVRVRVRVGVGVGVGVGVKNCDEEASTLALTTQLEPGRGLPWP